MLGERSLKTEWFAVKVCIFCFSRTLIDLIGYRRASSSICTLNTMVFAIVPPPKALGHFFIRPRSPSDTWTSPIILGTFSALVLVTLTGVGSIHPIRSNSIKPLKFRGIPKQCKKCKKFRQGSRAKQRAVFLGDAHFIWYFLLSSYKGGANEKYLQYRQ